MNAQHLTGFNLTADGQSTLGICTSVKTPSLNFVTIDKSQSGSIATSIVKTGRIEKMEVEITLTTMTKNKLLSAVADANKVPLVLNGHIIEDGQERALVIEMIGVFDKMSSADLRQDSSIEIKISGVLTKYKYTIDGETCVDIDSAKHKLVIGDKDHAQNFRKNMGIE